MNKRLLITSSLLIGLSITSLVGNFNNLDNHIVNKEVKKTPENKFSNALPYDFFGDYSHPKLWVSGDDVYYHNPSGGSEEWPDVEAHEGIGIKSFTNYTKEYNKYLLNNGGYDDADYVDQYYGIVTDEYIDGFNYLDPYWKLLDISYYLEDWIVWNINEVQNYDDKFNSGVAYDNDDVSLLWAGKINGKFTGTTIKKNENNFLDHKISEYDYFQDLGIGRFDGKGYGYWFKDQPISNEADYDFISDEFGYDIYDLERLILPKCDYSKENIDNKISEKEAHEYLVNYDYQSSRWEETSRVEQSDFYGAYYNKMSGFEAQTNRLIFEVLNKDDPLVNKYGWDYLKAQDEIISNENESHYIGYISQSDYDINYEISDDGVTWTSANTLGEHHHKDSTSQEWVTDYDPVDVVLSSIEYLRISINLKETTRTNKGAIRETFKPKLEWGIEQEPNIDPVISDKNDSSLLFFWIIGILGAILIIGLVIYAIHKRREINEK